MPLAELDFMHAAAVSAVVVRGVIICIMSSELLALILMQNVRE